MTEYLEAGDFSVDAEARTVRGLLLPWGEQSRLSASQTEPIAFERGAVAVPSDVSIVTANRFHDRHDPVGRATSIEDTEQGLVATFSIARTTEGDEFLDQYKDGSIRKLSAELAGIVRQGARGIKARLTGAGFVTEGAFASAALFAVAEPETVSDDVEPHVLEQLLERIAALEALQTPEPTEAEEETPTPTDEPESPATEEETTVAEAQVPNTATAPEAVKEETSANGVFELITSARRPMGSAEAETMLAALADIKTSGAGALPAPGVLQPAWLGELWAAKSYARRYFPLLKNGTIQAMEEKGFRLNQGAELMQRWTGTKTELPTGTGSTSLVTGEFERFAFAVDIAREFYDIPGNQEVIAAFVRGIVESYARVSDKYALDYIYNAATVDGKVDRNVYPSDYPVALGQLIEGIDRIDDTEATPSFAIVAPDVYTELRYTPKDKLPEFVNFGAGRQEGTADGVTVLRDKFGVLEAGDVLVGSREAAHLNELGGGSPLLLDALDIARGGVDKAAVAYVQSMVEYPEGFVVIAR
jgi:hypothetical protein